MRKRFDEAKAGRGEGLMRSSVVGWMRKRFAVELWTRLDEEKV